MHPTKKRLLNWLGELLPRWSQVLDLGCGNAWYWDRLPYIFLGVDAWSKSKAHVFMNLEREDLLFHLEMFRAVFMLDFIEHLNKERGLILLDQIAVAPMSVILTPLIWSDNKDNMKFSSDPAYSGNPFEIHQSLWTAGEFKKRGYQRVKNILPNHIYLGIKK